MKLDDFDFDLPPEAIAQRPVVPRDRARLLRVGQRLSDHRIRDLPDLLRPGDLLVFNDTRVIPARLIGRRGTARIEITLHKETAPGHLRAFAKPARKLSSGDMIDFGEGFRARIDRNHGRGEVSLIFDQTGEDFAGALNRHGHMPLPPYIRRGIGDDRDREDYQTLFAARDGAVAAPTAGLHFTPELGEALSDKGIESAYLTLHVGAGTFLPIRTENPCDHVMHAEWGEITPATADKIAAARAEGGRIVAVGTTSLRLLETAAAPDGEVGAYRGETDIFVTPGYRFKTVDLLLTNFHLPRSTLFMLVSALAGTKRMQTAYAHAIDAGYRFYSYGDACLIEKNVP